MDGKKCRYGYGNYPQISLENARKIHTVARGLIAFGKHPATLLDTPGAIQNVKWTPPSRPPASRFLGRIDRNTPTGVGKTCAGQWHGTSWKKHPHGRGRCLSI
ncbi:MAG: hypothetical protein ACNA7G_09870 [Methylobacter sp.]